MDKVASTSTTTTTTSNEERSALSILGETALSKQPPLVDLVSEQPAKKPRGRPKSKPITPTELIAPQEPINLQIPVSGPIFHNSGVSKLESDVRDKLSGKSSPSTAPIPDATDAITKRLHMYATYWPGCTDMSKVLQMTPANRGSELLRVEASLKSRDVLEAVKSLDIALNYGLEWVGCKVLKRPLHGLTRVAEESQEIVMDKLKHLAIRYGDRLDVGPEMAYIGITANRAMKVMQANTQRIMETEFDLSHASQKYSNL